MALFGFNIVYTLDTVGQVFLYILLETMKINVEKICPLLTGGTELYQVDDLFFFLLFCLIAVQSSSEVIPKISFLNSSC